MCTLSTLLCPRHPALLAFLLKQVAETRGTASKITDKQVLNRPRPLQDRLVMKCGRLSFRGMFFNVQFVVHNVSKSKFDAYRYRGLVLLPERILKCIAEREGERENRKDFVAGSIGMC